MAAGDAPARVARDLRDPGDVSERVRTAVVAVERDVVGGGSAAQRVSVHADRGARVRRLRLSYCLPALHDEPEGGVHDGVLRR